MNYKPVTPALHGIIDYIFSGILLAAPPAIGLNDAAIKTYGAIGASFLVGNAFTDTPVGVQPVLTFKHHQISDALFLTGLSVLSFTKFISKNKKSRAFHFGFLALAVAHYALTDYNARSKAGTPQTTNE